MNFSTARAGSPAQGTRKRYGTIAARIGSEHLHRLGIAMPAVRKYMRVLGDVPCDEHGWPMVAIAPGARVSLIVQDITRHPELRESMRWVCASPLCAGRHWPSKSELLKGHPENKILTSNEEIHLYMAVVEIPAVPAAPEKRDDKGKVLAAATEARDAVVMLLSDEE